jgi:hypothetical protein
MNGWPELDGFLRTDPRDAGCGKAMELLHVYARVIIATSGSRAPTRH